MKKFVILSLLVLSLGTSAVQAMPTWFGGKTKKERAAEVRQQAIEKIDRLVLERKVADKAFETGIKSCASVLAASYFCSAFGASCTTACALVPTSWPVVLIASATLGGSVGVGRYALEFKKIVDEVAIESFFKK